MRDKERERGDCARKREDEIETTLRNHFKGVISGCFYFSMPDLTLLESRISFCR